MDGWHVDLSKEQLKDGSQISALGHLVDHGANGQDEKERGGPCSRLLHARRLTCTAHFSGLPDTTSPHLCKRRSPGTVVECLAQRLVPGTALWPAVPQPGCQPSAAASPGRSAGAAGEGRREREPQLSTRPAAITSVHICEFRTPVTLQANPGFPRINPMN